MKNNIAVNYMLTEQISKLHDEEMNGQHAIEKNVSKINTPELKMLLESSVRKAGKNSNSRASKLYIKNMVSIRCIMLVKSVLESQRLQYTTVELGHVKITENLSKQKRDHLKAALLNYGLELMDDKKNILVEKVKNLIIGIIHFDDDLPKTNFSDYLSEKLNHNYTYLANLFSKVRGTTIEHFILTHKIERVKELMVCNELSLSEIAWKLHYSSVAHLSNQFKKITGLTPTCFKNMKRKRRVALENL